MVALRVAGRVSEGAAGTGAAPTGGRRGRVSAGFLVLAVAYFLFGLGYVITATFLIDIVRSTEGIRPLEPYAWVLVGLGAAPSVALWTAIGRRIGRRITRLINRLVHRSVGSPGWRRP